jgi:hypothetical protein
MPRPTNKEQLKEATSANYSKLLTFIQDLSDEEIRQNFPSNMLNRNVRDVLAHLYHWHLLFFKWYEKGMKGEKPAIPEEGYSWKTTPDLNHKIRELYSGIPITQIFTLLENSHSKLMKIIDSHSEEELFEKKRFKWTGTTSLAAYAIGAGSSHYDWALKIVKKGLKG